MLKKLLCVVMMVMLPCAYLAAGESSNSAELKQESLLMRIFQSRPIRALGYLSQGAQLAPVDADTMKRLNQGAALSTELASNAGQVIKEKTEQTRESVMQQYDQAKPHAIRAAGQAVQFTQRSPLAGHAAFMALAVSIGVPQAAMLGLVQWSVKGISASIDTTAVRQHQRIDASIGRLEMAIHAVGGNGLRMIDEIDQRGSRKLEELNAMGIMQQQRLSQTMQACNRELRETIHEGCQEARETLRYGQETAASVVKMGVHGLAYTASIGIGSALLYKNLVNYDGSDRAKVLAALGGAMVAAPVLLSQRTMPTIVPAKAPGLNYKSDEYCF